MWVGLKGAVLSGKADDVSTAATEGSEERNESPRAERTGAFETYSAADSLESPPERHLFSYRVADHSLSGSQG
jgi:hypothetical protein